MAKKKAAKQPHAPAPVDDVEADGQFPTTLYRKHPVTQRRPNGYEPRRANDAEERDAMLKDGWKESPADL